MLRLKLSSLPPLRLSRAAALPVRWHSTSGTPFRFKFLMHTDEFQDLLEARTAPEALEETIVTEMQKLAHNRNKESINLDSRLLQDLFLDESDVTQLKYDLAEQYNFRIPTNDEVDWTTGRDVLTWLTQQTAEAKAKGNQKFQPRNLTDGVGDWDSVALNK